MPQTTKARRLRNAKASYDRKRQTFDEKCAVLSVLFNLIPVSLATRRFIGRRLEEMSEDYTRLDHRVEITKLEERNQVAAERLISRLANKAAERAAGRVSRAEAKRLAKLAKELNIPPSAPPGPISETMPTAHLWSVPKEKQDA